MNHLLMLWSKADQLCVQQGSWDSMKLANSNHLDRLKPTVCALCRGDARVTNLLPRSEASQSVTQLITDAEGGQRGQEFWLNPRNLQARASRHCAVRLCAVWQAGCAWGITTKNQCS